MTTQTVQAKSFFDSFDTHKQIQTSNENGETVNQRVEGKDGKIDVMEFRNAIDAIGQKTNVIYNKNNEKVDNILSDDMYKKWLDSCIQNYNDIYDEDTLINKIRDVFTKFNNLVHEALNATRNNISQNS